MLKTEKVRTGRLHIRLSPELREAIVEYCKRHEMTLSSLVTRFFNRLLEKEKQGKEDVDQF